jgi:hypothetical protein
LTKSVNTWNAFAFISIIHKDSAIKELAANACVLSDGVNKLVNAHRVFKSWVMLSHSMCSTRSPRLIALNTS